MRYERKGRGEERKEERSSNVWRRGANRGKEEERRTGGEKTSRHGETYVAFGALSAFSAFRTFCGGKRF
jgi:hypothetical protein